MFKSILITLSLLFSISAFSQVIETTPEEQNKIDEAENILQLHKYCFKVSSYFYHNNTLQVIGNSDIYKQEAGVRNYIEVIEVKNEQSQKIILSSDKNDIICCQTKSCESATLTKK